MLAAASASARACSPRIPREAASIGGAAAAGAAKCRARGRNLHDPSRPRPTAAEAPRDQRRHAGRHRRRYRPVSASGERGLLDPSVPRAESGRRCRHLYLPFPLSSFHPCSSATPVLAMREKQMSKQAQIGRAARRQPSQAVRKPALACGLRRPGTRIERRAALWRWRTAACRSGVGGQGTGACMWTRVPPVAAAADGDPWPW